MELLIPALGGLLTLVVEIIKTRLKLTPEGTQVLVVVLSVLTGAAFYAISQNENATEIALGTLVWSQGIYNLVWKHAKGIIAR